MRRHASLLAVGLLGCSASEADLGEGPARPPPPLVAPAPAAVFEAGTGGGPLEDVLLIAVVEASGGPAAGSDLLVEHAGGRATATTDAEGLALLSGLEAPVDVHVFADTLYRSVLDVRARALTVRLGRSEPGPPPRRTVEAEVEGLSGLPEGPVRFAHVRHWAWPRSGGIRDDLPVSEDVAIAEAGRSPRPRVRVPVPAEGDGALLALGGVTEQARLTSWGREVGWEAVTHVGLVPLSEADEPAPVSVDVPLSARLRVVFPESRRFLTRLQGTRWEARYELVHPQYGATRALAGVADAPFGAFDLLLRVPAAFGGFEDVRFAITIRAYDNDWWLAERTFVSDRVETVEIEGFPSGRPGRTRDGRRLTLSPPPDARFLRLIFQSGEPGWWVDALDSRRREVDLPLPPLGRPDPLERPESPLMRAHFFEPFAAADWNGETAPRWRYLGMSVER